MTNYDNYKDTIEYLNNSFEDEVKPELSTNLDMETIDNEFFPHDIIKKYIENNVVGISTIGESLEDLDLDQLHARDIETINGSIQSYQEVLDSGYTRNDKCIDAAYRYVDENDPEIIRRMRYYYKQKPIRVGDRLERYNHMKYNNLKQQCRKDFNRGREPKKHYKKKNNKRRK